MNMGHLQAEMIVFAILSIAFLICMAACLSATGFMSILSVDRESFSSFCERIELSANLLMLPSLINIHLKLFYWF